jgi:hypothetical protein
MKNILLTAWALSGCMLACGINYVDVPVDALDTRLYYTPDPELQPFAQRAVDNLAAGTGLPFSLSAYGVPVRAVEPGSLYSCDADGVTNCHESCAWTVVSFDRTSHEVFSVRIDVEFPGRTDCMKDMARTVEHEMIHSVRRYLDQGDENSGHSLTGVFQAYANDLDNKLNEESLLAVCKAVDCNEFNPEE